MIETEYDYLYVQTHDPLIMVNDRHWCNAETITSIFSWLSLINLILMFTRC